MPSTSKEKKRKDIRVSLSQKDLDAIGAKDVPQERVIQWIKIGRERAEISEIMERMEQQILELKADIEAIKNEQRRHIALSANHENMSVVLSSLEHFKLKLLRKKVAENVSLTEEERSTNKLIEIKSKVFRSFMDQMFPKLKTSSFLNTKVDEE